MECQLSLLVIVLVSLGCIPLVECVNIACLDGNLSALDSLIRDTPSTAASQSSCLLRLLMSSKSRTILASIRRHVIPNYHFIILNTLITIFAALLCAGLTSYKGLKETEVKPGQFCTIVGAAGGLGHLAIQYAKAMGMRVGAIDVGEERLSYCKSLGADFVVDAKAPDAARQVIKATGGGSH